MISIILFILILQKLDMLSGIYLALIIIDIIVWIIGLIANLIKFGIKIKEKSRE